MPLSTFFWLPDRGVAFQVFDRADATRMAGLAIDALAGPLGWRAGGRSR